MRRHVAALSATTLALAVAVPVALAAPGNPHKPAIYLVGGTAESIDPTAEMLANDDFYMGGYGFASGHPGNVTALPSVTGGRFATGVLGDGRYGPDGDGVHTRAFSVSDGEHTIVLSQIETQGYFDAYQQGPFGINEIRQDAVAQIADLAAQQPSAEGGGDNGRHVGAAKHDLTAAVPTPSQIIVDSDHSHGGPDTAGVWGGVPTSYLELVHDRTVAAIVEAWQRMQPAVLSYGVAHAGVSGQAQYPPQECLDNDDAACTATADPDWLLTNQFRDDPNNQAMDDEVRVLQATDPDTGEVLDTYLNYSAHPTVLGSDNRKVTGDYVGRLAGLMQQTFGGFAMDQVGTLGRTQPARDGCHIDTTGMTDDQKNLCALDEYAGRVLVKIQDALDAAEPFTGKPVVGMNSYLLNDPTTSAVLAGIVYAGKAIGAPAGRANTAPWYTGTLLGTSVFSGRIGNVLINGGPGEFYPQIPLKVRELVEKDNVADIQGVMNIGTAGDFLGYIIAPLEAYPKPIQHSFADDSFNPDPIGNDNYFFNISHTFGERLTCDLLRGAGDILANDKSRYWSAYDRCPAFVNDYVLDPGTDMSFPQQPNLYESAHPVYDHM